VLPLRLPWPRHAWVAHFESQCCIGRSRLDQRGTSPLHSCVAAAQL
jgi:hypothetical protein